MTFSPAFSLLRKIGTVLLLSAAFLSCPSAGEAWKHDIGVTVSQPSQSMVNATVKYYSSGGSTVTDLGEGSFSVQTDDDQVTGIHNTYYQTTFDLPMTRFILGTLKINFDGMRQIVEGYTFSDEAYAHYIEKGQLENIAIEFKPMSKEDWIKDRAPGATKAITEQIGKVQDKFSSARFGLNHFMGPIPFYVLTAFFLAQLTMCVYLRIFSSPESQSVSMISHVLRYFVFLMALLLYRNLIIYGINLSNMITELLMPEEAQTMMMKSSLLSIVSNSVSSNTIGDFFFYIFRSLAYLSVKILLIIRDVVLSMTTLLGPMCISIGYFSVPKESLDFLRKFLSGWIESFVKVLMWGPFAALAIMCMTMISIIGKMGSVGVLTMAIFGISILFVAKDIPKMTDSMSGVALMALVGALAPLAGKAMGMGVRGTAVVAGTGAVLAGRGTVMAAGAVGAGATKVIKETYGRFSGGGGANLPAAGGSTASGTTAGAGVAAGIAAAGAVTSSVSTGSGSKATGSAGKSAVSQSEQARINGQTEALDKTLSENQINAAEMEAAIKAMRADPRFSDSKEMQDGLAKMETAFGNMQEAGIPMNGGSLLEIAQGAKPILGKASVANAILSVLKTKDAKMYRVMDKMSSLMQKELDEMAQEAAQNRAGGS